MSRLRSKKSKIKEIIYSHVKNNKREYLIITILFFIGIILSIILFNNLNEQNIIQINDYLNALFDKMKTNINIDFFKLLKESIINNIILAIILWFGAPTIIGIPVVYSAIILKGFSIGYTISAILATLGIWNGLLISTSFLILHNIILVPSMFAVSVSGLKLYKSIMKNKQRENVKFEVLRHTIFCFIMLLFMIIASVLESYLSTNIGIILIKNIKI